MERQRRSSSFDAIERSRGLSGSSPIHIGNEKESELATLVDALVKEE
jgi:hypothetical protein